MGPQEHAAGIANRNVVHESEAQRQHVRVKLPGQIELFAAKGESSPANLRFSINDLSAGGVSFVAGPAHAQHLAPQLKVGSTVRGQVMVTVDGIAITVPVKLQIVSSDLQGGRIGAQFQDLGAQEVSTLRHLIGAFLAGEVVGVGDLLHTLGRENYTKARANARGPQRGMGVFGRMQAVMVSLLFLIAGLAALLYTVGQVHESMFVTRATAAKVAGTVFTVAMPREGTFFSLIPEDGLVKKGAPIASFEAAAIDLVRSQALSANLSAAQLEEMLARTVKGTITSPCDCRVQSTFVADNQYVSRGDPLFELTPQAGTPHLLARFSYDQSDRLQQGAPVQFQIGNDGFTRQGKVTQVRVAGRGDSVDSDLLVTVTPDAPLDIALVNRPARVSLGESYSLTDLIPVAMAKLHGAAPVADPGSTPVAPPATSSSAALGAPSGAR